MHFCFRTFWTEEKDVSKMLIVAKGLDHVPYAVFMSAILCVLGYLLFGGLFEESLHQRSLTFLSIFIFCVFGCLADSVPTDMKTKHLGDET